MSPFHVNPSSFLTDRSFLRALPPPPPHVGLAKAARSALLAIGLLLLMAVPALGQTAQARVAASPATAAPGSTVTVTLTLDMSGVPPPNERLGGYDGFFRWNPAVLQYVSRRDPSFGNPATNDANAANGSLQFGNIVSNGPSGNSTILTITFRVIGSSGSSPLDIDVQSVTSGSLNSVPVNNNDGVFNVSGSPAPPPPPGPPAPPPAGGPSLSLSRLDLTFRSGVDGQVNPQEIAVGTSDAAVTWSVTSPQSWITVTPTSGQGSGILRVALTVQGGNPGIFAGKILVTAAAGTVNSPQTINVTLVVSSAVGDGPRLSVNPETLSYSVAPLSGLSTPQTVTIANVGGGQLDWTVQPLQPWIRIGSTSSAGDVDYVDVSVDASQMAAGTQTGQIRVDANGSANSPFTINVSVSAQAGANAFLRANLDTTSPGSAGRIDGYDVVAMVHGLASANLRFDINQDGTVDSQDMDLLLSLLGSSQ